MLSNTSHPLFIRAGLDPAIQGQKARPFGRIEPVGPVEPGHGQTVARRSDCTGSNIYDVCVIRPSQMVAMALTLGSWSAAVCSRSALHTATSASIPGRNIPFRCSMNSP